MFTVLYKWRLKSGFEQQFVEAWSEITKWYVENAGSLGSRLHRGSDGLWYGYAQWPSAEHRSDAFRSHPTHPARQKMSESIEESFEELRLEIAADHLKSH